MSFGCHACCVAILPHTPWVTKTFCWSHVAHRCMHELRLLVLYLLVASCLMCFLPVVKVGPTSVLWKCYLLLLGLFENGPWTCWLLFLLHLYLWWFFSYSISFWHIVVRNSSDASLSRICFTSFIPRSCNHCISLLYAQHISPDVLVFIGSTRMRFLSFL